MKFSEFIKTIDAGVRRECPAADLSLVDHHIARWTCDGSTVTFHFLDDAYKLAVEHAGIVIYSEVDTIDQRTSEHLARAITEALHGTSA